jgi:hypothetical protein
MRKGVDIYFPPSYPCSIEQSFRGKQRLVPIRHKRFLTAHSQKGFQSFHHMSRATNFALPYHYDAIARRAKTPNRLRVTLPIGLKFSEPKRSIAAGHSSLAASFVLMPKAAVNEDGPTLRLVGDIRSTRQ